MKTQSPNPVEMTLDEVVLWRESKKETSQFAANMQPVHFVGYTEEELDGVMMDRDELDREINSRH